MEYFIIKTPKGTEIEIKPDTVIVVEIDGVKYEMSIKKLTK